jgi:RNA polymerase sigma-70 factor, ECF subfamily
LKRENSAILLEKAQNGDIEAFHQLYDLFKDRVYSVAFGILGQQAKATEATQDAFIKLYKSIHKVDKSRPFFTYLYRVTVNACFDLIKRQKTEQEEFDETAHLPETGGSSKIETDEIKSVVRRLAGQLSPQQRAVFVMRYLEELELDEIKDILKSSASTVRSNLFFARKKMKELLEKNYPEFLE